MIKKANSSAQHVHEFGSLELSLIKTLIDPENPVIPRKKRKGQHLHFIAHQPVRARSGMFRYLIVNADVPAKRYSSHFTLLFTDPIARSVMCRAKLSDCLNGKQRILNGNIKRFNDLRLIYVDKLVNCLKVNVKVKLRGSK